MIRKLYYTGVCLSFVLMVGCGQVTKDQSSLQDESPVNGKVNKHIIQKVIAVSNITISLEKTAGGTQIAVVEENMVSSQSIDIDITVPELMTYLTTSNISFTVTGLKWVEADGGIYMTIEYNDLLESNIQRVFVRATCVGDGLVGKKESKNVLPLEIKGMLQTSYTKLDSNGVILKEWLPPYEEAINETATINLRANFKKALNQQFKADVKIEFVVEIDDHLVLWNKLGTQTQIQNSEVGASFAINGPMSYMTGIYGQAFGTDGQAGDGTGYIYMNPADFYGTDRTKGTIEMWLQKKIEDFHPGTTPLLCIFGYQPWGGGNLAIRAMWSDGYSGHGGMAFYLRDHTNTDHEINDLGWNDVPVDQWVHMAFVWDLNGIDGTADKMRIYRDGIIRAASTISIPDISTDTAEVRVMGHHAYNRFGSPTAYMDNLKTYSKAKTDFSDRFAE